MPPSAGMSFPPLKPGCAVDEDRIPISRLTQAGYCLRRAALLENEQIWIESADTAKGRMEHERVHTARVEKRSDCIRLYEYPIYSEQLQLSGKCDCIEAFPDESGCQIPASNQPVRLYPVEYKHGKVRSEAEYEIQLCAQAICLEEMFHTSIPEGALFYISSHRRLPVLFTEELRSRVVELAQALKEIRLCCTIPPAEQSAKCLRCSLREYCLPELRQSAENYCKSLRAEAMKVELD